MDSETLDTSTSAEAESAQTEVAAETTTDDGTTTTDDVVLSSTERDAIDQLSLTASGSDSEPDEDEGPSAFTMKMRLAAADLVALIAGFWIAIFLQWVLSPVPAFAIRDEFLLTVMSLPAFAVGAGFNRVYQHRANARPLEEATNVLKALGVGMAWMLLVSVAVQYTQLSRLWIGLMAISLAGSVLIERRIARSIFRRLRNQGRMVRRIVIVGTDAHAIGLMHAYDRDRSLGYKVVGFAGDDDLGVRNKVKVLGPIDNLVEMLKENDAVGVVVSLASVDSAEVNALTRELTDQGFHVALSSSLRDIDVTRLRPQTLDGRTMIYVEPVIRTGWRSVAKRIFDVMLATAIMIATLPIQFVAAIAIKATSKGPVLFRQIRVGKDGELFTVLKFRTMGVDAEARKAELASQNEADGPLFKMEHDPRVTSVGRILRKLSIDELPQLICVLIGTMSMVGPRPALPTEVDQWDDSTRERLRVLPGLTGMWQVSGRSDSSFEVYKRMDLYYVDNWSLLHDVRICARTVGVVLTGSGAS